MHACPSPSHRIDIALRKCKEEWSRLAAPCEDVPPIIPLPWAKLVTVFAQQAINALDPDDTVWLPWQQFESVLQVFEVPAQWCVAVSHTTECVDVAALAYKEERERRRWVGSKGGVV